MGSFFFEFFSLFSCEIKKPVLYLYQIIKTKNMDNTITKFFKGDLYTMTVAQGRIINAYYECGAKVFNPALLDNLSKII